MRPAERGIRKNPFWERGDCCSESQAQPERTMAMETRSNSRRRTSSFLSTHYVAACVMHRGMQAIYRDIHWDPPFTHIFIHPTNRCWGPKGPLGPSQCPQALELKQWTDIVPLISVLGFRENDYVHSGDTVSKQMVHFALEEEVQADRTMTGKVDSATGRDSTFV